NLSTSLLTGLPQSDLSCCKNKSCLGGYHRWATLGVDRLEFDGEGMMEICFVTMRSGSVSPQIPGTSGDNRKAAFSLG
ncbi:MAG: hypothetical protein AAFO01_20965, partial [Pseudomonadota bacterium]